MQICIVSLSCSLMGCKPLLGGSHQWVPRETATRRVHWVLFPVASTGIVGVRGWADVTRLCVRV